MTLLAVALLSLRWPGFGRFRTVDRAAKLSCPLLVMVGGSDRISPVSDAQFVADAASDGELHVFDGAGHLQAACKDRDRYTQISTRYLGRCGKGNV